MADAVVTIFTAVNAVGAPLVGGEFRYALYTPADDIEYDALNDARGLVTFTNVTFDAIGVYQFFVSIAPLPNPDWDGVTPEEEFLSMTDSYPCWTIDLARWRLQVEVYEDEQGDLHAMASYPDGIPFFANIHSSACSTCGEIVFDEITYSAPGVYNYMVRELTPSGGGWISDDSSYEVVVTVIDDGFGNLVATVEYPDGFPTFRNTYDPDPARVIISGCKIAIGAALPADRFVFGLYDEDDNLISSVTNGAAPETIENPA